MYVSKMRYYAIPVCLLQFIISVASERHCAHIKVTSSVLNNGALCVKENSMQTVRFDVISTCADVRASDFVITVDRQNAESSNAWYPLCIVGVNLLADGCSCLRGDGESVVSCQMTERFSREMTKYRLWSSDLEGKLKALHFDLCFNVETPTVVTTNPFSSNKVTPSSIDDDAQKKTTDDKEKSTTSALNATTSAPATTLDKIESANTNQFWMILSTVNAAVVVILIVVVIVVLKRRRTRRAREDRRRESQDLNLVERSPNSRPGNRANRIYEEIGDNRVPRPTRCHRQSRGQSQPRRPSLNRQEVAPQVRFVNTLSAAAPDYLNPCVSSRPDNPPLPDRNASSQGQADALDPDSCLSLPGVAAPPVPRDHRLQLQARSSRISQILAVSDTALDLAPPTLAHTYAPTTSAECLLSTIDPLAAAVAVAPVIIPNTKPASPQHCYIGLRARFLAADSLAVDSPALDSVAVDSGGSKRPCKQPPYSPSPTLATSQAQRAPKMRARAGAEKEEMKEEQTHPLDLSAATGTYRRLKSQAEAARPRTKPAPEPSGQSGVEQLSRHPGVHGSNPDGVGAIASERNHPSGADLSFKTYQRPSSSIAASEYKSKKERLLSAYHKGETSEDEFVGMSVEEKDEPEIHKRCGSEKYLHPI